MSWKDYETLDATPEKATEEELKKLREEYGLEAEEDEKLKEKLKENK